MTDAKTGKGVFAPVPFTFTYTCETEPREVTWQGRGRKPRELLLQVKKEKNENGGVSETENRLNKRNPRHAEAAERKAELQRIREEKRADRDRLAAERADRKAAREAAREAAKAAEGQQAASA